LYFNIIVISHIPVGLSPTNFIRKEPSNSINEKVRKEVEVPTKIVPKIELLQKQSLFKPTITKRRGRKHTAMEIV
jgi:hypothetical protein